MSRYRSEIQQSACAVIWRLTFPLLIAVCMLLAIAPVVRETAHGLQHLAATLNFALATGKTSN